MKTDHEAASMNALSKAGAPTQPLQQTRVDVRIRDLVARFELEHQFRNGKDQPIEALLTFPMPPDAAFLGLDAEIGGKHLAAKVIASGAAEERYGEALSEGNTAILVQTPEPGIVTLSLGNLLPGEGATVRLRFATRVPVAGSSAWFRLPTVLRPRYGKWFLEDFERPEFDMAAEHPLSVAVEIEGLLHGSAMSCPSHAVRFEAGASTTRISIPSAYLDRDVVLQFDLLAVPPPTLDVIQHGDLFLANLTGPVPESAATPGPIELCLLLDGSGSMAGDAIMQSRDAVRAIAGLLGAEDRIQVLRFGSTLRPIFRRLMPCKAAVRQALDELAGSLEADLGGTEMGAALLRAVQDLGERRENRTRVVILVTDGAVQPHDLAEARKALVEAGIRVFVVAVGSSAGVEVLRPLAHGTGGLIERSILGEPIDAAAARMARRARHPAPLPVTLSWPGGNAEVLPMTPVYPGDALEVAVVADARPTGPVVVQVGGSDHSLEARRPAADDALLAILGQARYGAAGKDARQAIALAHGLLTRETSAILVHERAEEERAESLPLMVKVPSMMPAGMVAKAGPVRSMGSARVACSVPIPHPSMLQGSSSIDASLLDLDAPLFSRRPPDDFDFSGIPALVEAMVPALRALIVREDPPAATLQDLLGLLPAELEKATGTYFGHLRLRLHDSATLVGLAVAVFDGLGVELTDEEEVALALAVARYGEPKVALTGAFPAK